MKVINCAIVGGGTTCMAIMDWLASGRFDELKLNLIGVADVNLEAPAMIRAKARQLHTTTDYRDFFALPDLNLILELAGDEGLADRIQREKPTHVRFMDHTLARIFLDIARLQREKRINEQEAENQIRAVSRLFMDILRLEEEKALAQIEAEKRFHAERDYTEKVLDNLTDAVFILGADGVIETANEAFIKTFGGETGLVKGRPCYEVLFDQTSICSPASCPMNSPRREDGVFAHKEYKFTKNGKVFFYEATFVPLPDEREEQTRWLISMRDTTRRKTLTTELERSQQKYKHLFQYAREGIALFNDQGKIVECNRSFSHMLGFFRGEPSGMTIYDLSDNTSKKIFRDHPDDLKFMGSVSLEMNMLKHSGEFLPVEAHINWLPDEEVFEIMVRDISVRKKLEDWRKQYSEKLEMEVEERTRALRASEQETLRQKKWVEGILTGSPIPMFVLDRHHKITHWNRAMEKLTGMAGAEMIGTDRQWKPFYPRKRPLLADLIIEGDSETIHRLYDDMSLRRSSLIQGAWEAEHFFPHLGRDGTHLYFNAAPIKDEKGAIQGAVITYQDFSERERMTAVLKRREAFVNNLIQNSIDGVIATDDKGKIVLFNRGSVEILGYEPDEILGMASYREILSETMAREIRQAFYGDQYGPTGKIINKEAKILNKQGESIPVRLSGTLLYEKGREVGSVVFIQDLREIRRLRREKEEAKRMAAIGQTVAGLAHYIKNILNGLKGGGYVINSAMKKMDFELMGEGWRMVEKNIEQISHIVMDMLIYSRDRKPTYQPVAPNELSLDVLELMKERAKVSSVTLEHHLDPDVGPVAMDRTAIHNALLNLVSNAIDACTLKGITGGDGLVTVKTDRPEGWGVRFRVIDNGTGIDEETQKRLFKDFYTTKGYKGTGLGLPVTHKIVKEHAGGLFFETALEKGTTFTLLLPERDLSTDEKT